MSFQGPSADGATGAQKERAGALGRRPSLYSDPQGVQSTPIIEATSGAKVHTFSHQQTLENSGWSADGALLAFAVEYTLRLARATLLDDLGRCGRVVLAQCQLHQQPNLLLRGACAATSSQVVDVRYRNFFVPERRDIFAGFRSVALDGWR